MPTQEFLSELSNRDLWFPETATVWSYLESYKRLSREVQVRYNQLYSLGVNEAFSVFEENFLMKALQRVGRDPRLNHKLKQDLEDFCEEEHRHSCMFQDLNRQADPGMYAKNPYVLSQMANQKGIWALELCGRFPMLLGVWVWIAVYFEERTILYAKKFVKDTNVSPIFKEIHRRHMMDEVHHVKLDEQLIEQFYKPLGSLKKRLAVRMFQSLLESYSSPKRMSLAIARVLKSEFPLHTESVDECLKELPSLKMNRTFQRDFLGPEAAPRTWRLMNQQPEMHSLIQLLESRF